MYEDSDHANNVEPLHARGFLLSIWARLAAPLAPASSAAGRRRRMLAWLLVALFLLTVASLGVILLVDSPGGARHDVYIPFIAVLDLILLSGYWLNALGHYRQAAGITVISALVGPWGSAWLDPGVLRGDFVPLAYTMVSVLLSSILLTPGITTALAAGQLLALGLVAYASPVTLPINWPAFLILVVCMSVLSILSNVISNDDLRQIELQTRELAVSEAGLRELSVRDHLTGLFNRRYLEESLEREARRALRTQKSIGVILIDIDGFKQVNDTFGHAVGDVLLRELGQLFRDSTRGGDIACRYGGDEFVLMLPEASLAASTERAQHLQAAMRVLDVQNRSALEMVTLSAGIAVYPLHGLSAPALLKAADVALYRAKAAGRNRVMPAGYAEQQV